MNKSKAKGRTIGKSGAFPRVRPPARLRVYFASCAPICVLVRRGPTKYSQLILWNTKTDKFTPGQWTRGAVQQVKLSNDGRFIAMEIMGARPRFQREGRNEVAPEQIAILCRPPYFTALKCSVGSFCLGNRMDIPPELEVRGKRRLLPESLPEGYMMDQALSPQGMDHRGRHILLDGGKVFLLQGIERKLLFDANLYDFEEIEAPEWALTYHLG